MRTHQKKLFLFSMILWLVEFLIISQEKQLEQIQQISETEKMARPRF